MKREWLKVLAILMMAVASFGGPVNPTEIEDLMHIMNETRIEFTIPDDDDKGEGDKGDPHELIPGRVLVHLTGQHSRRIPPLRDRCLPGLGVEDSVDSVIY